MVGMQQQLQPQVRLRECTRQGSANETDGHKEFDDAMSFWVKAICAMLAYITVILLVFRMSNPFFGVALLLPGILIVTVVESFLPQGLIPWQLPLSVALNVVLVALFGWVVRRSADRNSSSSSRDLLGSE